MQFDLIDTYASVLSAVFGGVGVKVLEKIINKRSEQFMEASRIREELRTELTYLREELEGWKRETDDWRGRYYEKVEENIKMITEIENLRNELHSLQAKFTQFTTGSK